jgi:hypothetical protein
VAALGEDKIAFAIEANNRATQRLAIATISDGRILRRLDQTQGIPISALAASPDGRWLYYSDSESVWALDTASPDAAPRKLARGGAIAADPGGAYLIAERPEQDAPHLFRIALPTGFVEPVPTAGPMRLTELGANSVSRDGRVLLSLESPDSWWDFPGILDPRTGRIERVDVAYSGDLSGVGWTPDGRILATGLRMQSSIWRYQRESASSTR